MAVFAVWTLAQALTFVSAQSTTRGNSVRHVSNFGNGSGSSVEVFWKSLSFIEQMCLACLASWVTERSLFLRPLLCFDVLFTGISEESELLRLKDELIKLKANIGKFLPLPLTNTRTQNLVWVPWCDSRNRASQYLIEVASWQRRADRMQAE